MQTGSKGQPYKNEISLFQLSKLNEDILHYKCNAKFQNFENFNIQKLLENNVQKKTNSFFIIPVLEPSTLWKIETVLDCQNIEVKAEYKLIMEQ